MGELVHAVAAAAHHKHAGEEQEEPNQAANPATAGEVARDIGHALVLAIMALNVARLVRPDAGVSAHSLFTHAPHHDNLGLGLWLHIWLHIGLHHGLLVLTRLLVLHFYSY